MARFIYHYVINMLSCNRTMDNHVVCGIFSEEDMDAEFEHLKKTTSMKSSIVESLNKQLRPFVCNFVELKHRKLQEFQGFSFFLFHSGVQCLE